MDSKQLQACKNFKILRVANGYTQQQFSQLLNISLSLVKNIEQCQVPVSDTVLEDIKKLTGLFKTDLLTKDLSKYLETKDLVFEKNETISEMALKLDKWFLESMLDIVLIIEDKELMNNSNYRNGINLINSFKDEKNIDFEQLLNSFHSAYEETKNIICAINFVSSFAIGWNFIMPPNLDVNKITKSNTIAYSLIDLRNKVSKIANINDVIEFRKSVVEENTYSILNEFLDIVRKSKDYYDYAYYYVVLAYSFGIFNSDSTKLSFEECHLLGESMIEHLARMGNKYASTYIESLYSE